jgi:hypothetical protein
VEPRSIAKARCPLRFWNVQTEEATLWSVWKERSHGIRLPCEKLVGGSPLGEWWPTLNGQPVPPRPRHLSQIEQNKLRQQVVEWQRKGFIERNGRLTWTNNVVLVAKKNGTTRVCIDCRPANAVTEKFDWPLPRLLDLRLHLKGARWFARLDLKDAFLRIRIPTRWRHLTAFTSDGVDYQFTRMIFGLKTAPSTFQRFMDHMLQPFKTTSFVYMDDILIYSSTLPELRRQTRQVKRTIKEHGCVVNEEKSEYERQGLLYAGLWVYSQGQGPNHQKVREVLALHCPRTKPEKRSALGMISYLRDFIPLASLFTASLAGEEVPEELLKKEWRKLLEHICKAITTLGPWEDEQDADLFTDASLTGAGAILIQNGRIISLVSRKLTKPETRYSATDREHLSLALAAKKMKIFLHRSSATTRVHNDHQALLGRKVHDMTPRQARTYEIVSQNIPHLLHVKGTKNPADFISRWGLEITGGQMSI